MLETQIYRRADHCLFAWKAIRDQGRIVLFGQTKRGQPLVSGYIEFFDAEQMLALDSNAEVWFVPSDLASPAHDNEQDWTREIEQLMVNRRDKRSVTPLTSKQTALYRRLVVRRRQP